jgi:hypothetical protein
VILCFYHEFYVPALDPLQKPLSILAIRNLKMFPILAFTN